MLQQAVAIYFVMDMVWVVRIPICVKSPHVIVKVRDNCARASVLSFAHVVSTRSMFSDLDLTSLYTTNSIMIVFRHYFERNNKRITSTNTIEPQHHIAAMLYLVAPIAYPYLRWLMGVILSVEINTWFLICRRVVYRSNGSAKVSPAISYTVSALFYVTWIVIRCYLYPRYMIIFLQMWMERYQQTGIVWHIEVIFMPVHFALCALNLKWSYDLFTPIIKRWLGTGPKQMVVQSGL